MALAEETVADPRRRELGGVNCLKWCGGTIALVCLVAVVMGELATVVFSVLALIVGYGIRVARDRAVSPRDTRHARGRGTWGGKH